MELTPNEIRDAVAARRALSDLVHDEWDAISETVERTIMPVADDPSFADLVGCLVDLRRDPIIASILVELSWQGVVKLTDFMSDRELLDGCLAYLGAVPEARLEDGLWAWKALWSTGTSLELPPETHFRILVKLIEEVPWDDEMLAMIGDGPFASAESAEAEGPQVEALVRADPKWARIRQLMTEGS